MKNLILLMLLVFLFQSCSNEAIFELQPSQSMSITGKGPGQDAAINPYGDTTSKAIVRNIGGNEFKVRIQNNDKLVEYVTIDPNDKKLFILPRGHQLYLDSDKEGRASVDFKKYKSTTEGD